MGVHERYYRRMIRRRNMTTSTVIRSALRRLWLRSRERSAALRAAGYCCARCGRKASRARGRSCVIEVHHVAPVDWGLLEEAIRALLLVPHEQLIPLCRDCHAAEHSGEKEWIP